MMPEASRPPMGIPPLSQTFNQASQPIPEYATKEQAEQAFFGLLKETVSRKDSTLNYKN
jgi:hypothetical protein